MAAIDFRELFRFILSGSLSTLCNLAAVATARLVASYDVALLFGIAAGVSSSFLLTKFFTFRSRKLSRASGEAGRFLVVYGAGLVVYYFTAQALQGQLVAAGFATAIADLSGVVAGAALMTVTGYFGHRHFTYRTVKQGQM
jgi:putative flippase GtrA